MSIEQGMDSLSKEVSQSNGGVHEPFAIYLSSITETFPTLNQEITLASVKVLEGQFNGKLADSVSWAVFYNQVANELTNISTQAAAELYGRAYDTERPYRVKTYRPMFAFNFIKNYAHFIKTVQNPSKEQKEWIVDRKSTLEDAAECINHFWQDTIAQEGLRQAPRKGDNEQELAGEWDSEALAQANKYFEVYNLAQELQAGPLKFI